MLPDDFDVAPPEPLRKLIDDIAAFIEVHFEAIDDVEMRQQARLHTGMSC
jgi:hypothetical protein